MIMTKIKIKEFDQLEQIKRLVAYKLSEKFGFGTLVLDPYGAELLFILDIAEKEFGKEAKEQLWEFLEPYHKMRALQILQAEGLKSKWWIVAPYVGAKPDLEDEEEDFILGNDRKTPVSRDEENSTNNGFIRFIDNNGEGDFKEDEEDDELLFD